MPVATDRSPFLDFASFTANEIPSAIVNTRESAPVRSPFLSVYETSGGDDPRYDAARATRAVLLNQLYDEEFDSALFELQCRGRSMHDAQLAMGKPRAEADRVVSQHFSRLIRASETMVDSLAREFAHREQDGIVDHEVDTFMQGYTAADLDPEFENFFGKLVKKIGGAVKSVASKVAQVALGPALNLIKRGIQPILQRVLQWAIGKLPVSLQPVAERLAQKLGFAKPAPVAPTTATDASAVSDAALSGTDAGNAVQAPAGSDAPSPQEELDDHIVSALLAQDDTELELEAAQFSAPSATMAPPIFAELDDARERFIREMGELDANESAEPIVQNFLPAILPALRIGLKLIGRPKVVNFLGGALAGLIAKLIGPDQSQALGRAIADAGLKLMSLEMSSAEQAQIAPAAVAATVEETVARIASLPEEVLDNQEVLEGYLLEAFENAAAANLPALFSETIYRQRPGLLEAGVNAGWVLLPLRGPKRYKRCTRTFDVKVSPHLAEELESFEGATLAEHLQDQLGLDEADSADGKVYLYEALPGTTLTDIAHGERETLGAGLSDEANVAQLHPLTPEAAGALLGQPALGRALQTGASSQALASGQRLYHMATGRRPLMGPGRHRRMRLRHLLHLNLTLDDVNDQVRLCVFLSEVKAQKLASRLRQGANPGQITAGFQRALGKRLHSILRGHAPKRLRILHPALRPGLSATRAMQNVPLSASGPFMAKLQAWIGQAFAEYLKAQSQKIIAATEDAADGITFQFKIEHPPGLKSLGQVLTGQGSVAAANAIAASLSTGTPPTLQVEVKAGHVCD